MFCLVKWRGHKCAQPRGHFGAHVCFSDRCSLDGSSTRWEVSGG